MLTITIKVKAPGFAALAIKEDLAMHLERWGDASVVSVVEDSQEQRRRFYDPVSR